MLLRQFACCHAAQMSMTQQPFPLLQVPNDAAGYYLLGKICRLTNRHKVAVSYQKAALTVDPLLWCAYEELCMLGDVSARLVSVTALLAGKHRHGLHVPTS